MAKLEKEVKILNVNVEDAMEKLDKIGAKFISKKEKKIFTSSINIRFNEALLLMKSDNNLLRNTALKKLAMVLDEFKDLVEEKKISKILEELGLKKYSINPNKWIRLRKSNDKTELTIKHIYEKNTEKSQKVKEYERVVSNLE